MDQQARSFRLPRDRQRLVEGLDRALDLPVRRPHAAEHRQDVAPSLLLIALDNMNVAKSEAVYVGDGTFDLRAAKDADIRFVLVRTHDSAPEWEPAVESFDDLPAVIQGP